MPREKVSGNAGEVKNGVPKQCMSTRSLTETSGSVQAEFPKYLFQALLTSFLHCFSAIKPV